MSKKDVSLNIQEFQDLNLKELFSKILNILALIERKHFLEKNPGEKANGFYDRQLSSGSVTLDISVPRTRNNTFRPSFLPEKWQRHIKEDYISLAQSLLISSKSVEAAKRSLKQLNLPVSEDCLEEVAKEIRDYFDDINNCVLDSDLFALIVDAKHIKLKTKTSVYSYTIYSAVGISLEGKKQIVSIDICEGRESVDGWRAFFKRLLNRGLRRVLIVVHDDFPGLSNLVNTFFPNTDDQICTVHLLRNLKKELSPEEYKLFNTYMKTIKNSHSYELGSELFDEACEKISRTSPAIADRLISKKEKYLAFLRYPYEVRPSISSTNLAESINRKIEDAEQLSGGYFHSMDDLKLKLGILIKELHFGKWRKPTYKIASVSHILNAEFVTRFETDDNHV